MSPVLSLAYDGPFSLNNARLRGNVHAHRAEARKLRAWAADATAGRKPWNTQVRFIAQMTTSQARYPDPDAISLAVKHLIDGVVDAGIIPDDSPEYVAEIRYLAPVKTGTRGITLRMEPAA